MATIPTPTIRQSHHHRPRRVDVPLCDYADSGVYTPHTWAGGSTFECEFDFPVITHKRYGSAQPDQSKIRQTPSANRPAEIEPAPKPKRVTTRTAQGTKLTPEERKERQRATRAALRQRREDLGICRDCKDLAVPGKTLCPDCAEKHSKRQR